MSGSAKAHGGETALTALGTLLDAYGADPARWPVDDPRRPAAWALVEAGDPAAARLLAEARALDGALHRALDAKQAPAPTAALTGAILQAARKPVRDGWRDWATRLWKPAGALACAALLGVAVGVLSPVPVAGVGSQQIAGLETEMASLSGLEDSGLGDLGE